MSEIKWIKISTDIFNDEAVQLIETMPEGDAILLIWFKLLIQAGLVNDNGYVYFKKEIPYTDEMLSTVFRKPANIIRIALQTFQKFGMIEITDTNSIFISNWEFYQNIEKMEKIKQDSTDRVRKFREKQKQIALQKEEEIKKAEEKAKMDLDVKEQVEMEKAICDKESALKYLRKYYKNEFLLKNSKFFKNLSSTYDITQEEVLS